MGRIDDCGHALEEAHVWVDLSILDDIRTSGPRWKSGIWAKATSQKKQGHLLALGGKLLAGEGVQLDTAGAVVFVGGGF